MCLGAWGQASRLGPSDSVAGFCGETPGPRLDGAVAERKFSAWSPAASCFPPKLCSCAQLTSSWT